MWKALCAHTSAASSTPSPTVGPQKLRGQKLLMMALTYTPDVYPRSIGVSGKRGSTLLFILTAIYQGPTLFPALCEAFYVCYVSHLITSNIYYDLYLTDKEPEAQRSKVLREARQGSSICLGGFCTVQECLPRRQGRTEPSPHPLGLPPFF